MARGDQEEPAAEHQGRAKRLHAALALPRADPRRAAQGHPHRDSVPAPRQRAADGRREAESARRGDRLHGGRRHVRGVALRLRDEHSQPRRARAARRDHDPQLRLLPRGGEAAALGGRRADAAADAAAGAGLAHRGAVGARHRRAEHRLEAHQSAHLDHVLLAAVGGLHAGEQDPVRGRVDAGAGVGRGAALRRERGPRGAVDRGAAERGARDL
mmetsp:Transcript_39392/g.130414  ORF Transcript_39392/g.130414 Transcript_39392/m.130414 type:complete len:214 (+) Transcript_39392:1329-1970(+)